MVTITRSTIQNGWTALKQASINGHQKVVEVLLRAGANPDIQNKVRGGNVQTWTSERDMLYIQAIQTSVWNFAHIILIDHCSIAHMYVHIHQFNLVKNDAFL